jgi:hypothetical protein
VRPGIGISDRTFGHVALSVARGGGRPRYDNQEKSRTAAIAVLPVRDAPASPQVAAWSPQALSIT